MSKKSINKKQSQLIQALEGIGDILVYETRRKQKNKTVIQGLKRIENIIKKLFEIKENDPSKFEQILLSQEFLELYKKDEDEAKLRLAFNPEEYIIVFSSAINQILRIHEASLEVKNDEISRFATYHLSGVLANLTRNPNNVFYVEQILKALQEVSRQAILAQNISMFPATIHWYVNIVFDKLKFKDKGFHISYLGLLDRYFFSAVQFLISKDQKKLFEALVSSMVDGLHLNIYEEHALWDYAHIILEADFDKYNKLNDEFCLEDKVRTLSESLKNLDDLEKLNNWKLEFEKLKQIIFPLLSKDQGMTADKIEEKIFEYIYTRYKYHNLLEIVFNIGAYCLFKNKISFIKYIWEYKQPSDADAVWIGSDIIPNNLDELTFLYFKRYISDEKFEFWEGHHGTEKYYKEYFLLLLAKIFQNIKPNDDGKFLIIQNYNLPTLDANQLFDLEKSIDGLIALAKELHGKPNYLEKLGFSISQLDEIFNCKLMPFLESLKVKSQERIKTIKIQKALAQKKIEEFKNQVIQSLNELSDIRNILDFYHLYNDRSSNKKKTKSGIFGIKIVDDKAIFFEDWHEIFPDWGRQYGRNMALGENQDLFKIIGSYCEEIVKEEFKEVITKLGRISNTIIIASNELVHDFLSSHENYLPYWNPECKKLSPKSFRGTYLVNKKAVPVFGCFHSRDIEDMILILNITKLGQLIQLDPIKKSNDETHRFGYLYLNIQSLNENRKVLKDLIEESPSWLQEIGDQNKQREHLLNKVLIDIYEKYEFKKHQKFKGYVLKGTI